MLILCHRMRTIFSSKCTTKRSAEGKGIVDYAVLEKILPTVEAKGTTSMRERALQKLQSIAAMQSIISACSRCSCFCAFACVLLCRPTSVTIDCLKFLAPSVGWVRLQSVLGSPRAPCSMHAVALLRALLI